MDTLDPITLNPKVMGGRSGLLARLATEKLNTMTASRPHDDTVVDMLRADPGFAAVYLATAMDEADQPGGQAVVLAALRQIAEAQGMVSVAARAGLPRESLYRALSPRGNPTLKTLLALVHATGLRLAVSG